MRYFAMVRPLVAALLVPVLATGCASLTQQREALAKPSSQVVTNEPAGAATGPSSEQPAFEDGGSDLALGVARLVANDGRWSDVIHDDPIGYSVGCRASAFGDGRGPLADGGVYRSFEPRAEVRSWVFVGIALGGDGFGPAVYGGTCGSTWVDHSLGTYAGRLAPEVAGRDTSLLFTRSRRTLAKGGATDAVGGLVERFIPRGNSGDAGRTAKPRTAQPAATAASAPAKAAEASAPAAKPASTKPSSSDRPDSGGSEGRSDSRARPWGSP